MSLLIIALACCSVAYFSIGVIAILPGDYQSFKAQAKCDVLWKQITDTPYDPTALPTEDYNMANFSKIFLPQYTATSFLHTGDEMPGRRVRIVHTFGSVCTIALKITAQNSSNPFTGVFHSGGVGLLRVSPALQNNQSIDPGLGIKILIDGANSQNFILLNSREGQGTNRNFFANSFFNVIHQPVPPTPVDAPFEEAIQRLPGGKADKPESGLNMGLFEQASVMSDGKIEDAVVTPYLVTFKPNPAMGWGSEDARDYRLHLGDIPVGSLLFTVSARLTKDGADQTIGEVKSTSAFVASSYGDKTLFFNHARKPWRAANSV